MLSTIRRRQRLVSVSKSMGCEGIRAVRTYDRDALRVGSVSVAVESAGEGQQHAAVQQAHHTTYSHRQKILL
jgi:hypothetical protein